VLARTGVAVGDDLEGGAKPYWNGFQLIRKKPKVLARTCWGRQLQRL